MQLRRTLALCTVAAAVAALAGAVSVAGSAGQPGSAGQSGAGNSASRERQQAARSGPAGSGPARVGLDPRQLRAAYDVGPLLRRGIDGAGQTIVIVDSYGSPTIRRDLRHFDASFGLAGPPWLRVIQPAGQVTAFRPTGTRLNWAQETTLDVEWAHVLAPAARILLVETPTAENEGTSGFRQIVKAETYVIRHHLGDVISQSLAATEQTFRSKAALLRLRGAYLLAARPSYDVTVLGATGDWGAAGLTYSQRSYYLHRAVAWPASDPLVTAVGGTLLDLTAAGNRRMPDAAWSDGGGGRSVIFARPGYQNRVRGIVGRRRGLPDISMDAACQSAVATYSSFNGEFWSAACGTSLATPLFAGIVALADQVAGHPLGLINRALYRMAAARDKGIVDVVKGNNTFRFVLGGKLRTVVGFAARRGYDLSSGLGTVNAAYFVPELARLVGGR